MTYITDTTPGAIDVDGTQFYFYREHFPEGRFAGYQSKDRRFRFMVDGKILTGAQLADLLCAEYEQVSEAGIRAAMTRYAEFRALPI